MTTKQGYIYILSNKSNTVVYTGVTIDLVRRIHEHRNKLVKGFTEKYNIHKLVYYEVIEDMQTAIAREKQVKGWVREKKNELVKNINPEWRDLYDDICG